MLNHDQVPGEDRDWDYLFVSEQTRLAIDAIFDATAPFFIESSPTIFTEDGTVQQTKRRSIDGTTEWVLLQMGGRVGSVEKYPIGPGGRAGESKWYEFTDRGVMLSLLPYEKHADGFDEAMKDVLPIPSAFDIADDSEKEIATEQLGKLILQFFEKMKLEKKVSEEPVSPDDQASLVEELKQTVPYADT